MDDRFNRASLFNVGFLEAVRLSRDPAFSALPRARERARRVSASNESAAANFSASFSAAARLAAGAGAGAGTAEKPAATAAAAAAGQAFTFDFDCFVFHGALSAAHSTDTNSDAPFHSAGVWNSVQVQ